MQQPEEYFVSPTPWVPNSELPLLIYRGACAHCENEDEIKTFLESNGGWLKGASILPEVLGMYSNICTGRMAVVLQGPLSSQCT